MQHTRPVPPADTRDNGRSDEVANIFNPLFDAHLIEWEGDIAVPRRREAR